jgi:hypothetical protein
MNYSLNPLFGFLTHTLHSQHFEPFVFYRTIVKVEENTLTHTNLEDLQPIRYMTKMNRELHCRNVCLKNTYSYHFHGN